MPVEGSPIILDKLLSRVFVNFKRSFEGSQKELESLATKISRQSGKCCTVQLGRLRNSRMRGRKREREKDRERERERKKKIGLIILIVDGLKRLDIVRNHTNEDKAFASTVPLKPSNSECAFPVRARCLSSIAPLAIVLPVLSCQWAEENHRGEEGKPVDSSSPWQLAWTILPVSLPS